MFAQKQQPTFFIYHRLTLSYETGLLSMCEMEFAQVDFTLKVRVYSESSEE